MGAYPAIKNTIQFLIQIRDFEAFHWQWITGMPVTFRKIDTRVVSTTASLDISLHDPCELDEGMIVDAYSLSIKIIRSGFHLFQRSFALFWSKHGFQPL